MSWQGYIDSLMKNEWVADAAIFGYAAGKESCWAAKPDGWLKDITAAEIKVLVANDHSSLFANGVTLAGRKCTMLRDALHVDGQNTMDLKMKTSDKEPDPFPFTVGKSQQAVVVARGIKDAHGGKVNCPVYDMTAYLRKMNY
ncbi:profilin-1 [Clarias gariepinus]|uniref:profilin-1 n=1 Tax=Clarias gariepinus TaxID=13013 RepID=UPI00234DB0B5|nr:profilin-1 [Clarias gariepinus]